jgi:hypothetical protein
VASTVTGSTPQAHTNLIAGAGVSPKSAKSAARRHGNSGSRRRPEPRSPGKESLSSLERDRLLQFARALLEPLASLEMLCEADRKMENTIFYMNRTAVETMNLNYQRLNPMLRGADVRAASGRSIHQFHKDPEKIRDIFRAMIAGTVHEHRTELALGGIGVTPKSETGIYCTLAAKGAAGEEEIGKATSSVSVFPGLQGQGGGAHERLRQHHRLGRGTGSSQAHAVLVAAARGGSGGG